MRGLIEKELFHPFMGSEEETKHYYKQLTDLIRVIWETDKLAVRSGELNFAFTSQNHKPVHEVELQLPFPAPTFHSQQYHEQLRLFYRAVFNARTVAVEEVCDALGGRPAQPVYTEFVSPVTKKIYHDAIVAMPYGRKRIGTDQPDHPSILKEDLRAGYGTAVRIITYLLSRSIHPKDIRKSALITSKADLMKLDEMLKEFGLDEKDITYKNRNTDLSLPILPLTVELLWGGGTAEGCPAGKSESKACRDYFAKKNVRLQTNTIYELHEGMQTLFNHCMSVEPIAVSRSAGCPYHNR